MTGTPPSEVTVSAISRAPWSWQSWPRPSSDCWAPVEVSAWTSATAFTLPAFFSASSMAARVKVWPQGTSSFTRVAPQRPTMSAMRAPKTPDTPTMTVSPGSMTLTSAASMPADPVPEMAMVNWFCVWKAVAEHRLHLVHDDEEGRVEVADQRRGHGAQDPRAHHARAGAEEQAVGGLSSAGMGAGMDMAPG